MLFVGDYSKENPIIKPLENDPLMEMKHLPYQKVTTYFLMQTICVGYLLAVGLFTMNASKSFCCFYNNIHMDTK